MRTFHPRMAWIYWMCQQTVGGGAGWGRGGVRGMDAAAKPQGRVNGVPRDPNPPRQTLNPAVAAAVAPA